MKFTRCISRKHYTTYMYALSESVYEETKNKCVTVCQHLMLLSFSKEISGFAVLKRKIREQDKSPDNVNGNASEARVHKKKNGWTAFLNKKWKEVS